MTYKITCSHSPFSLQELHLNSSKINSMTFNRVSIFKHLVVFKLILIHILDLRVKCNLTDLRPFQNFSPKIPFSCLNSRERLKSWIKETFPSNKIKACDSKSVFNLDVDMQKNCIKTSSFKFQYISAN